MARGKVISKVISRKSASPPPFKKTSPLYHTFPPLFNFSDSPSPHLGEIIKIYSPPWGGGGADLWNLNIVLLMWMFCSWKINNKSIGCVKDLLELLIIVLKVHMRNFFLITVFSIHDQNIYTVWLVKKLLMICQW